MVAGGSTSVGRRATAAPSIETQHSCRLVARADAAEPLRVLYGLRETPLYPFRHVLFKLFVLHTRLTYRRLARLVAREIEECVDARLEVRGVIGLGGSPSCGVCTTLDLRGSFETMSACPLAQIDADLINEQVVGANRVAGEGMFIAALRRRLDRRGINVPFVEHDLIAELRGVAQPIELDRQPSSARHAARRARRA